MPDRPVYVYRLEVEYPDHEPPMPAEWLDDGYGTERPPPTWPVAKRYLSQSGAATRARMLRGMGCTVKIHRSQRVVFDA